MRGGRLAVHHAVGAGESTAAAGACAGREVQQQALTQEVQQLRKALQEHGALQRRLAEAYGVPSTSNRKPPLRWPLQGRGPNNCAEFGYCAV
jgi:hypothetical protein